MNEFNAQGLQSNNPQEWFGQARVAIPGYTEVLWQPLYDYQTKTAVPATSMRFFAEAFGTNSKTINDTNLELQGQLSKGQAFKVTGIVVEYYPTSTPTEADAAAGAANLQTYANDMLAFYKTGVLNFRIGTTSYCIGANLMQFAPQRQLNVMAAYASTVAATSIRTTFANVTGQPFRIVDKLLESNMQFSVTLENLGTTTATGRVGVRLNGYLGRNAQG